MIAIIIITNNNERYDCLFYHEKVIRQMLVMTSPRIAGRMHSLAYYNNV